MAEDRIIRWGVLGTARIAEKVGAAIRATDGAELSLIGSRDAERAATWAKEHQVLRSCDSYQAVLDDDEIDAVYVPLPPSMHEEWTCKAAEAGKHVLCEKPLAHSLSSAQAMAAACRQHGVQLMDGIMWVHHPRAAEMRGVVTSGSLGELRRVTSAFSFNNEFPASDLRMQRSMGGGALLDLGWYNVNATLGFLGSMPTRVFGTAKFSGDVDTAFSAIMWFEDGCVASFDCSFNADMRRWIEVTGTGASLVCDDFTKPWNEARPRYWLHKSGESTESVSSPLIQEECMVKKFCEIVRSGDVQLHWPRTSLQTQQVCEALDRSARIGEVVELTEIADGSMSSDNRS